MKMNEEMMNLITRRAEEPLRNLAESGNAITVAAQVYCDAIPDKTPEQGALMAERAAQTVDDYILNIEQALDNPEQWAHEHIAQLYAKGGYNALTQALRNLNYVSGVEGKHYEDLEPTPERTKELMDELYQAILGCSLGEKGLEILLEADENGAAVEQTAQKLRDRHQAVDQILIGFCSVFRDGRRAEDAASDP